MIQKIHLSTCLLFGAIAAVAYSIPMTYFIYSSHFADSWWLYVGNILFMIVVGLFLGVVSRRRHNNPNTSLIMLEGHVVTAIGIITSCIIAFILLMIFVPHLFGSGPAGRVLEQSPAQAQNGKTDGLVLLLFMNAIVGNVAAGSFISVMLPYTMKRNQTKESVISRVKVDTQ